MTGQSADRSAPVFRVEVDGCGRIEVGPTRTQNQDAILVATAIATASGTRLSWSGTVPDSGLPIAVIDGMGGYAGGNDAAALVAAALAAVELDKDSAGWDAWFESLSLKVARAGEAWGTPDMGATAALLAITPRALVATNVGDCRIYRVVGGHLGQLSVDDRTDDLGSKTVTQAIGGSTRIDAHTWVQDYTGGHERYVLCSDGVWDTLDPHILRDLCTADRPPSQIVDAIAFSIYAQLATDNCSIIVIDLDAAPAPDLTDAESNSPTALSVAVEVSPHEPAPTA